MCTFTHGYTSFVVKTKVIKKAETHRGLQPNFMEKEKFLADSNIRKSYLQKVLYHADTKTTTKTTF